MNPQLPLALKIRHAPSLDGFITGANGQAIQALRQLLDDTGEAQLYLFGSSGCGRTHLLTAACIQAEQQGRSAVYLPLSQADVLAPEMLQGLAELDLLAVDDVHRVAGNGDWERALFVLYNECRERGTRLLFSADRGPASLPTVMPDLRSRLSWGLSYALGPLNDADRLVLLRRLAERQALELPDEVARYLLERTPRHPKVLIETVARLDRASLAEQRRLTIPFVRAHI